jgi:hypothetical protein
MSTILNALARQFDWLPIVGAFGLCGWTIAGPLAGIVTAGIVAAILFTKGTSSDNLHGSQ